MQLLEIITESYGMVAIRCLILSYIIYLFWSIVIGTLKLIKAKKFRGWFYNYLFFVAGSVFCAWLIYTWELVRLESAPILLRCVHVLALSIFLYPFGEILSKSLQKLKQGEKNQMLTQYVLARAFLALLGFGMAVLYEYKAIPHLLS